MVGAPNTAAPPSARYWLPIPPRTVYPAEVIGAVGGLGAATVPTVERVSAGA